MRIHGERYDVHYDPATARVSCSGILDLRGKQSYKDIAELLDNAVNQEPPPEIMTLDVRKLEFLNSSGITTLGGFVIKLRNKGGIRLIIRCSDKISWQERSMKGLTRLMPEGLEVSFE